MVKRLAEIFGPGDRVHVFLADREWHQGLVVRRAHPGLWVRTDDGRHWFVTNGRRIKAANAGKDE